MQYLVFQYSHEINSLVLSLTLHSFSLSRTTRIIRASADEMRMKAVVINQGATTTTTGNSTVTTSPTANLVENEELPKANPLPPASQAFGPPPAYDIPRPTVQPQFPPQHLPPFGQPTTGATVTY